jgi:primosomal protein N'
VLVGAPERARRDAWSALFRPDAKIVIRVRSVIIGLLQNVKLIIVDEERERLTLSRPRCRRVSRKIECCLPSSCNPLCGQAMGRFGIEQPL